MTIRTYGWKEALVATQPGDVVYPYPRLDRSRVGPPVPQTYETIVLENAYLRLAFLPELGGRLYSWLDKQSGREMLYANPVIKPTHWGARGWWLAAGGIEWAFPTEEHGLVEWRPWDVRLEPGSQQVSITLTTPDDRTGLVAEVKVTLYAGRSCLYIRPRIYNPTAETHSFQFWSNGMFALSSANRPGPELTFVLPGRTVTVHSTGDPRLPGAGSPMDWPVYRGIDVSRYGSLQGWLGVFGSDPAYLGAYDPASDMGVARAVDPSAARGAKVFGPVGLDPAIWTDDGSGYVELWSGLTPSFWDDDALPPGASVGWEECWYSVNGLGGLSYANGRAALWLHQEAGNVQAGALTTVPVQGRLVLESQGNVVASWEHTFAPGAPLQASHPGGSGDWRLSLLDQDGRLVADYETSQP